MRKHGIPYNTAKIILEKIINLTGDEEASMRRAVLERNYKLPPENLKGYTQLKEFLPEQDLNLLEKYVKTLAGEVWGNTPAGKVEKNTKEKDEKKEKIKKKPYIDLEDDLYLAVWDGKDNYKFAHLSRNGEIELLDKVEIDGITYLPREKGNLPVGYPTYDIINTPDINTKGLFELLKSFIWRYVDMKNDDLEMSIFFILSTWFYRKSNTTAYLRFIGDTGKGKSRMLKVIGDLCFYPIKLGGNATRSAIMRVQEIFHGTLVLDESDFKGDKENELTKYINSGFERGNPIIITNKNTYQVETYDPFSPKLFAMRHPFGDSATEGRLLSIEPYETHREDIPANLPLAYEKEVILLRNLLARWTLRNWEKMKMENLELIQKLPIEPRLKQLATPLSIILPLFLEDGEDEMRNKFVNWLIRRQREIIEHRANSPEGLVFNAIVDLANGETEDLPEKFNDYLYDPPIDGGEWQYDEDEENRGKPLVITTGMITEMTGLNPKKVRKILQELGFQIVKKKLKIKGKKKTPHVVILENAQRWVEAWRRYRDFSTIGEIPAILKDERGNYDLKLGSSGSTSSRYMHTAINEGLDLDTLRRIIKNKKSGVCYSAGTAGTSGTTPSPLVFKNGACEVNNTAGYEFSPEIPKVIITDGLAGAELTYNPSLAVILPYTPTTKEVEVMALEDVKVSLPKENISLKKGERRSLPQKVAEILAKSGKVEKLGTDFTYLFRHMEIMEKVPEEMPREAGQIVAIWEN